MRRGSAERVQPSGEVGIVAGLDEFFQDPRAVNEDANLSRLRIQVSDSMASGVFRADRNENCQRPDRQTGLPAPLVVQPNQPETQHVVDILSIFGGADRGDRLVPAS